MAIREYDDDDAPWAWEKITSPFHRGAGDPSDEDFQFLGTGPLDANENSSSFGIPMGSPDARNITWYTPCDYYG